MSENELTVQLPPAALRHKSLADEVTERIAREIVSGALPAGQRLTEVALSERLGVSRAPIREALRKLSRDGLVDLIPRRGAQVAAVSVEDAQRLYECRMLLEPRACAGATVAITATAVEILEAQLVAMAAAGAQPDMLQFLAANHRYHECWLAVSPNEILRELIELTWLRTERYWRLFQFLPPEYIAGSITHHHQLHAAITAGAGDEAADVLRTLLTFALSHLTAYLESR